MATQENQVGDKLILKSISNPVVRIKRNPALDEAATALLAMKNVEVSSQDRQDCCFCGNVNLLASLTLERTQYLTQINLFKTYFAQKGDQGTDDGMETCANCFQDVITVWDLNRQIETIKQEINQIVEKVAALGNGGVSQVSKELQGEESKEDGINRDFLDLGEVFVVKKEVSCESNANGEDLFDTLATEADRVKENQEEDSSGEEFNPEFAANSSHSLKLRPKRRKKLLRDPLAISDYEVSSSDSETEVPSRSSIKTPLKPSKFPCPHCKKGFCSKKRLAVHIRLSHNKQGSKKCQFCSLTFSRKRELVKHTKWVHTKETFTCSQCFKGLATKRAWVIHEATVCRVPSWSSERLKSEFNIILAACPVTGCQKLFDPHQQTDLKKHVATHSKSTKFKGSKLEVAETEFHVEDEATQSKIKVTLTQIRCPHCGKKMSKQSLYGHIRLVHLRQRPYSCKQCEKTFTTSNNLSNHVKWIHTQETWPCSVCSKGLATQKSCAIHEATVCKVSGWSEERLQTEFNVTLVPCPVQGCFKLFEQSRPSLIKKHALSHRK